MTSKRLNHPGSTPAKLMAISVLCVIPLRTVFADGSVRTLNNGDRELLQVFKDNAP